MVSAVRELQTRSPRTSPRSAGPAPVVVQLSLPLTVVLVGDAAAVFELSAAAGRVLQFAVDDESTTGMAGAAISISSDAGQSWLPYTPGATGFQVPGSGVQDLLVRVDINPDAINPALLSNSFNLVVTSPDVPCPVVAKATILPLSSIGDRVWRDTNVNGQQDEGEAGVAGVVVELFASVDGQPSGTVLATTSTDSDGNYSFQNLQPGDYIVKFTAPEGARFTLANQGDDASDSDANASGFTASYTLAPRESINTVDAGLFTLSSIAGNVYHDANNDGVFDPTEAGIGGVNLTLTGVDAFGNAVSLSTTTAANGSYLFADLVPGTYSVTQTQPDGWVDGKDSLGSEGGVLANDLLSGINLLSGVSASNYNFGELLPTPPPLDPIVAPGVRTPGFWGSSTWSKFWDGVAGNEPKQARTKGFPVGDLQFECDLAVAQLRKSLDAFARLDTRMALEVLKHDDQIDQEFEGMMRKLITYMMEDPRTISSSIDLVFVAKAVERVGDHAKNLAEAVIYIVKGADVRHTPMVDIESVAK